MLPSMRPDCGCKPKLSWVPEGSCLSDTGTVWVGSRWWFLLPWCTGQGAECCHPGSARTPESTKITVWGVTHCQYPRSCSTGQGPSWVSENSRKHKNHSHSHLSGSLIYSSRPFLEWNWHTVQMFWHGIVKKKKVSELPSINRVTQRKTHTNVFFLNPTYL